MEKVSSQMLERGKTVHLSDKIQNWADTIDRLFEELKEFNQTEIEDY